jgi:hypothetical protein
LGGIVVGEIIMSFVKKNRTAGFKGEREGREKICGPELFKIKYVKTIGTFNFFVVFMTLVP